MAAPGGLRSTSMRRVDAEGELYNSPTWLIYVWTVLVVMTVLEAANEIFGIGGPAVLYEVWLHDVVLGAATVLVLARAFYEPSTRRAWLAFGSAMLLWTIGTVAWSIVYGNGPNAPYPTFADVLWLLWYPFMALGMLYLIRFRVRQFELHRWMDGIAVTLLVLVAGFALVVQPAADHTAQGRLATIVDFTYPVLDVILVGAVLGVYGLLGWRPDGMWILIGLGVVTMAVADAVFAVQQARGVADDGHIDFIWTLGALMIALAAWISKPDAGDDAGPVTGMRAIALALVAQALAIGIQIYALFEEVGKSERIVTIVVLVVASAQIILTRPRPEAAGAAQPPEPPLPPVKVGEVE
jgi:diguanylate cyclase